MAIATVTLGTKVTVQIQGDAAQVYSTIALLADGDAPVTIVDMTAE
jgi:hypothetical protein